MPAARLASRRRSAGPLAPGVVLLLGVAALAAGCGHPAGAADTAGNLQAATGPAPARRGGTLVTGWTAEPRGVNELIAPSSILNDELARLLFLHLVEEQPDSAQHPPTFKPLLARSFDWSADHKVLTFHLRDAVWSDGVPVTAEDVRFTWQAETDRHVAWGSSFMKKEITDVEVVDPHTARFHFAHAYLKQLLDANEGSILPRHVWGGLPFDKWRENADWFRQHLVVDGPFALESWRSQEELVLKRNERYFEPGRPYLDRVIWRVVPSQSSLVTQLLAGDLDLVASVNPGDARRVAGDAQLQLLPCWFRTWVAVAWNGRNPLFQDPEVRRALSFALDRKAMVETLWGPYARPASSPIVSAVWAHDKSVDAMPYRPDEARRLLAARGWHPGPDGVLSRGGRKFAFELTSNLGNQQRGDAAVMIQAQLRRVGIAVAVRQLEFNTLNDQVYKGTYEATIVGYTMDTSLDLTDQFVSRSPDNATGYSNPEVDRLIERAMSRFDYAQAKPDLDQIQRLLARDQPYAFLWESQRLAAGTKRLHDATPNLLFTLFGLQNWWIEPRPSA